MMRAMNSMNVDFKAQAVLLERLAGRRNNSAERRQLLIIAETLRGLDEFRDAVAAGNEDDLDRLSVLLAVVVGLRVSI